MSWNLKSYALGLCAWVVAIIYITGLGGCASMPVPTQVNIPTPVACKPVLGPEPVYLDTDAIILKETDPEQIVKDLLAGRDQRIQRDKEKSAALAKCASGAA
jgi:hypothetical protein